jgi:transcriptional regulator with XRE-family HTH domain
LSTVSEIEKANLSRIESGMTNPTVLTLLKICNAFDVKVTDLFNPGN